MKCQLLSFLIFGCLVISCKQKKVEEAITYSYVKHDKIDKIDTIKAIDEIRFRKPSDRDSLLFQSKVVLNGMAYELKKYSNLKNTPMDGGYSYYELDGFGVIYSSSHTWIVYQRLISNNDSINRILNSAMAQIIYENDILMDGMHEIQPTTLELDFREFQTE